MNDFMLLSSRDFGDLSVLIQVKNAGSLTKAARAMGITQSALSQKVKALEDRLGIKLLARTTRSLSLTQNACDMIAVLEPAGRKLEEIIESSRQKNNVPAGRVRLTAPPDAAAYILFPFLKEWLTDFPNIRVEMIVDSHLRNLVQDGLDGGVRIGGLIEQDMVSLKLTDRLEMVFVASPVYLGKSAEICSPKDLVAHNCLNLLIGEEGRIWPWPLEDKTTNEKFKLKLTGSFASTQPETLRQACLADMGIACLPRHAVKEDLQIGKLKQILKGWEPVLPGYYLYYPDKRYLPAAFQCLINGLKKWRKPGS